MAPRLQIHRPSPTTAEFTVTTEPPATIGLRLLRLLLFLLRVSLAAAALLVLHAKWTFCPLSAPLARTPLTQPPHLVSIDSLWFAVDAYRRSRAFVVLAWAAGAAPLAALVPGTLTLLYALSLRLYARESLLVLRGLGVQTTESPGSYLASAATRFIPTEKIQDIFINEAFRGFEVRYYLVVVVEGEEDVVVVFPGLLPRRNIVETVWRGARECLYEGRDDKVRVEEKS